jgi:undecaprenyl-diphosphatase
MIEHINVALFHLINQYAGMNPFVDTFVVLIAKYMPIIFVIVLLYIWIRKDNRYKDIALYSIYAAILGIVINYVIGLFYYHPRPFMVPVGTLLFSYPADSSFPSDHTTLLLSIAFVMTYFKETRKLGVVLIIVGLIEGIARVFAGLHFPFDILGSIVVAIIVSLVIYYFKDNLDPLNQIIRRIYSKIVRR